MQQPVNENKVALNTAILKCGHYVKHLFYSNTFSEL